MFKIVDRQLSNGKVPYYVINTGVEFLAVDLPTLFRKLNDTGLIKDDARDAIDEFLYRCLSAPFGQLNEIKTVEEMDIEECGIKNCPVCDASILDDIAMCFPSQADIDAMLGDDHYI